MGYKIEYHKHYRKHAAVAKVKREWLKLFANLRSFEPQCYVELTGVEKEDQFLINYHVKDILKSLNIKITNEMALNIDGRGDGFSVRLFEEMAMVAKGIDRLTAIVGNDYPEQWHEIECIFPEPAAPAKDKVKEYEAWAKTQTTVGFNKEFFAYSGELKKRLWPLTITPDDLNGVDKIVIRYQ